MVICEKTLIHRGSQLMLSGIILDIPTTQWLWKMCYTAQTQDSDIKYLPLWKIS